MLPANIQALTQTLNGNLLVMKLEKSAKYGQTLPTVPPSLPSNAWDFLINNKYHAQYCKRTPTSYDSMFPVLYSTCSTVFKPFLQDEHSLDVSFYIQFMKETLETLHALYENLKLNILWKE
jgi:anaphase-promoting complex subunit 1